MAEAWEAAPLFGVPGQAPPVGADESWMAAPPAPPEMIKNALRTGGVEGLAALAGQPANPAEHLTKMLGGKMLEGLTELAGAPGSLIAAMPKAEVPPSADYGQTTPTSAGMPSLSLPTTEQMRGGLRDLGMVQQPIQQPRNEGERILGAGAEGIGSTVPLAGIGGLGGLLARTGKTALQGFGSGVGSEIGRDMFGEAPQAGSLAGLLAGQAAAGGLYGAAGRGANAIRGAGNPVIDAYDLVGVTPRLAGDVTGRPMLQGMQQAAMSAPYGGRALHAAAQGANEFGTAVENQAMRLGGAQTRDQAGYALQQGGRDWMQGFRNAQQTAENAVSAKVPGTTEVSLAPVTHVLDQTARELPDAPHIAKVMTNPTFRELSGAIRADLRNPPSYANDPLFATEGTIPTQTDRAGLSWDSARAWRTRVGEELENSLVSRDGTDKTWKRIYGALSEALGDTATSSGAAAEWQAANQITNRGHQFIENTLSNIINHRGAQNSIPLSAATDFALGEAHRGGTRLAELRAMMPDATNQLASFKLRDMAAATPGRATAAMPVSANTFSTDLNRLSPEARTALFGNHNPELDALQTVAERGRETYQRYGNPSGTAGMMHWLSQLTGPFAVSGAYQAGASAGGPTAGLAAGGLAAVPYLAGPILGNLTAREALTRYLAAPVGGPGSGASRAYRGAAALPTIYGLTDERPR